MDHEKYIILSRSEVILILRRFDYTTVGLVRNWGILESLKANGTALKIFKLVPYATIGSDYTILGRYSG